MNKSTSLSGTHLNDKVNLVTGLTVGIGEAMVRFFASEGARVRVNEA